MLLLNLGFVAVGVSAGGWNRRVYYDALGCKGNLVHGIMVYQSLNCALSTSIVNSACEDKSTENPLSSEGTSCETVSNPSDSIYFPPADQAGKVSTYVMVNKYVGAGCSGVSDGFESRTIAADGKCYADERGSYFKATCNGQSATVFTYCKDSSCNECTTDTFDGSCQTSANGLAVKAICFNSANIVSSTTSTTGQTITSATNTSTQKNSVSSPDGTFLGLVLGILSALII
jgi:hypothetical protein